MRVVRIYEQGLPAKGECHTLSPEASQHAGVVLRMKPGERLILFSGDNRECAASVVAVSKKAVRVLVEDVYDRDRESPFEIHLGQGLARGDRMEWVVQKAVELGASSITPVVCDHSAVRMDAGRFSKKLRQWQAIAISACEQSGRNRVPRIEPVADFQQFLTRCSTPSRWILDPEGPETLRDQKLAPGSISLLVGPEGGFSRDEIAGAEQAGFVRIRMGPRILRTETASIVALGVLQAMAGDL